MAATDAPEIQREVLHWDEMGEATKALAAAIHADGYRPDVVLAIARGGLIVAASLAYALGVKNTFTMNVEFYTGVDERLPVPMILPPAPDFVDLEGAKVLIADDVADTGATLALVKEFSGVRVGEVRCATLYEKSHSTVKCEYVWRRTDDWIVFPWSAEPPLFDGSTRDA
jgi:hypoxanthine phosphoribosyltransferase